VIDNLGNHYYNSFNGLINQFTSVGIPNLSEHYTAALGNRYHYTGNNDRNSFFIFSNPNDEGLPVTSSSWRWAIRDPSNWVSHIFGGFNGFSQTFPNVRHVSPTNGSTLTLPSGSMFNAGGSHNNMIAVTNQFSTAWFTWTSSSQDLTGITSSNFIYMGYTKDSLYTTASNYIQGQVCLSLPSSGTPYIGRPGIGTWYNCHTGTTANHSITCEVTNPSADTTDLVPREADSNNKGIGRCWNLLRSPTSHPIGTILRNSTTDPDGSNNPFWVCVAPLAGGSVLMRLSVTNIL
jgi:hypothetical protein